MKVEHATSISGAASILGSWQICHAICLAIISALAMIGISVNFMPFLWLAEIVVYVWSFAAILLVVTIVLYVTKKCITRGMLTINTGLVIAGTPFLSQIQVAFWTIGAVITIIGITMIINDKKQHRCKK